MCILCVIQKWSRRVAMMLPWLVIPLIGLWALSQLLPPAFRFEITSPRLACVFVLLITLFWYEILMPQLSAWRVRRSARLREKKRFEAIELQKLRKTATRRCRNCLNPYRDQNPGGGRFMCSYCGHNSKRPVLDLPLLPGVGNNGIIKDLVGKGGSLLNGKVWSENGWMCGQDWSENENWVSGSVLGNSSYWRKNGSDVFGGDEHCLAESSFSGFFICVCKLLTSFFLSIRWLWRKTFRISSSGEDILTDAEHRAMLANKGENGLNYHESRGEKARRKAEEKRQARLEKELLEEEEQKQREEVAKLVEERRRLKDEKMDADKDCCKTSLPVREKDSKKEAEKKRQERRKDKDKGSSKSNSDAEELEKRAGKESEQKQELEKKSETDRREHQKFGTDGIRGQSTETVHGMKNISGNNFSRGNYGTRYLDHTRGTIFSSSRPFSGGNLFGKGINTPATTSMENKSNSSVDHVHNFAHKKDLFSHEHVAGKLSTNGDDKTITRPVLSEPQPRVTPKKSWQQLFTRSSSVPLSNPNVISRPNTKFQGDVQSPQFCSQKSSTQSYNNPINFGLPSPFTLSTYPNGSTSSSLGFSPATEPIFPHFREPSSEFIHEEPDLFEDPCYVPDPVSLLGPVSESLDNFQLDRTGFATDMGLERPYSLKKVSASSDINKQSPIEYPMPQEKHNTSTWFPSTHRTQDLHTLPVNDATSNEAGTWQMWNTSPLGQDGLGLVGGPVSWILPPEQNKSNKEDFAHPSYKTTASLFTNEDRVLSGIHSPQNVFLGNGNAAPFSPATGSSDNDPWLQKAYFAPLSGNENHFALKPHEESSQNEIIYRSPSCGSRYPFEMSPANCWSKMDWSVQGSGEGAGNTSVARRHPIGVYFPPKMYSHFGDSIENIERVGGT
ncbi:uncharacterized protein LOC122278268 isoform X2 [Carya illinoinensis]|uniref:Uncharacterized protein n=2 Tax=Carya illinoinensis TaxID=32201 RepID=A0A8T1PFC8_CARIL|nr:uncharacterized protein LOC122278268 isoform X2 [Carya illinoinensis]KAG6640311.1 hypothetical protein CIPAW_10G164200 [Carya illinoinensis]